MSTDGYELALEHLLEQGIETNRDTLKEMKALGEMLIEDHIGNQGFAQLFRVVDMIKENGKTLEKIKPLVSKILTTKSQKILDPTLEKQLVDPDRIIELKEIKSQNFDLTKLMALCNELNTSYSNECHLATIMIIRAILDHVPPVFGYETFIQVANNYGGKSFKKSMLHLQNSARNIADAYLHTPIRESETIPNKTQVNFSNDLDVLLAEIVRIQKHK